MLAKDEDGKWYDPKTGVKVGCDSAALAEMARRVQAEDAGDVAVTGVVTSGTIKEIGVVDGDLDQLVIHPDSIPVDVHYFNGFGNMEMEESANWVIRFCRMRGHFGPFTYDELNEWCSGSVELNGLEAGTFLAKRGDKFHLTLNFIMCCLMAGLRARSKGKS